MIIKFSAVIKFVTRRKICSVSKLFFVNQKIPLAVVLFYRFMMHFDIGINHISSDCYCLVNTTAEQKNAVIFNNTLPVKRKSRLSVFIKRRAVRHHYNICIRRYIFFEFKQFEPVFLGQNIIGIKPHIIITR